MALALLEVGFRLDIATAPDQPADLIKKMARYKFYLAFENGLHCRDYITERNLWSALRAGVVPVIWGPKREEVESFLPKNSFIFIEDFHAPEDLANYLEYLNRDPIAYRGYFKWRLSDKARLKEETGYCSLCKLLYEDDQFQDLTGRRPEHRVPSIFAWWFLRESQTCITPYMWPEFFANLWLSLFVYAEILFGAFTYHRFYMWCSLTYIFAIVSCRLVGRKGRRTRWLLLKTKRIRFFHFV